MDGSEDKLNEMGKTLLKNGVLPQSYKDLQGRERRVARATKRKIADALARS